VVAVYPHLGTVPAETWLRLFGSAQRDINILDHPEWSVSMHRGVVSTLAQRARAGVNVRICIAGSGAEMPPAKASSAGERYSPLRDTGEAEIRLHRGALYNVIYRADDYLVVAQCAYGVPAADGPVLHLQQTAEADMFATYVDSFERTWADAQPQSD
jgi:hypothetical protein